MNKNVFSTQTVVPPANTLNEAGGKAYSLTAEGALAQYAVTGTFNNTYYASAEDQTSKLLELANQVDSESLAHITVYSRQSAYMKDMPAVLLAILFARSSHGLRERVLFQQVAEQVLDDMKMIGNFCTAVRSGVAGRKSFGTMGKKAVQRALLRMDAMRLFRSSLGNSPSFTDIIRMVHPKFTDKVQNNMVAYLIGKEHNPSLLPQVVQNFEAFKKDSTGPVPVVDFRLLSSIKMTPHQWSEVAKGMSWHTLRMNLNTLQRNGVFGVPGMTEYVATTLSNPETIRKIKVMPYQIMAAYLNTEDTPREITLALQQAMEIATENVPVLKGNVVVAVDGSGSMSSPVTGYRGGGTTRVTCADVAGLIASSVLRTNKMATVIPFDDTVKMVSINPMDSVATNALKLSLAGGGTNCAAPVKYLNDRKAPVDVFIMVSDNMSWVSHHTNNTRYGYSGTGMATEWAILKKRNPKAKLVLIDIQPSSTTQVSDSEDVLNVGGFSDSVFTAISDFVNTGSKGDFMDFIRRTNATGLKG